MPIAVHMIGCMLAREYGGFSFVFGPDCAGDRAALPA